MDPASVLDAFRLECRQLGQVMASLSGEEWVRPTACVPWRVCDLLGHVCVVLAWLPEMLAAEPPTHADVTAATYYRPDSRFAPETNAARIDLAQQRAAAHPDGRTLADDFAATWQRAEELCRAEPEGRVVRTRHGDAMLLSDFLLTRVVEVAVHGLDFAAALQRRPWLTEPAGRLVTELLLGSDGVAAIRQLGWDRLGFLEKATGRAPISEAEHAQITGLGIRWLALG
ncbi:maleylpyruvate isomerase N-terminal domain-containing protein [Micromonospora sonneratiae]|uniref:Maleylpyruvate isomerase N-terminal domain-containing protein n=1 Tax=Micromonospora sonneratiae TaxID=1184706 RepID=A0ABW3YMB7_9ACTN